MFGNFEYNESLRKLTVAFGSLFNEIYVERKNADGTSNSKIKVPLIYSSKEKFIQRLEQQSGISDETKIQVSLPRLGFEMTNIDYDPTRHLNKLNKRRYTVAGEPTKSVFQEVPYNVSFTLFAYTRNMEDNLQIVEQIVPYFSPEFIVTLNLNSVDKKLDVPITLGNVAIQETYDGNFLDRRILASTFGFVCKTRLYAPIETEQIIVDVQGDMVEILGLNDEFIGNEQSIGVSGNSGDLTIGDIEYDS
tara:strand:+ start:1808 stop:2551 length:744 start_codon:yes stop_codon:yes gene_type:complete